MWKLLLIVPVTIHWQHTRWRSRWWCQCLCPIMISPHNLPVWFAMRLNSVLVGVVSGCGTQSFVSHSHSPHNVHIALLHMYIFGEREWVNPGPTSQYFVDTHIYRIIYMSVHYHANLTCIRMGNPTFCLKISTYQLSCLMLIRSTFVNILGVTALTQYIVYAVQLCTTLTVQLCMQLDHSHSPPMLSSSDIPDYSLSPHNWVHIHTLSVVAVLDTNEQCISNIYMIVLISLTVKIHIIILHGNTCA